jgi:methylation protein EvaC
VTAVCGSCWLIQLREVVPDAELYGGDYGFRTGASPAAVRYFGVMAQNLLNGYRDQARELTIEIACNDGTLLRNFAVAGCKVLGVDPVKPALAEAAAAGMDVIAEPFTSALAGSIRDTRGPAGLVIACNVVAHVADPLDFLLGIAALLSRSGRAVIEFQDAEKLIAGCQVDHVYHEHRFFYALRPFSRLARRAGLAVMDWERTEAQGGSLRVTLARTDAFIPEVSTWLEAWAPYADMQDRAGYLRQQLLELVFAERAEGRVVAGSAASAKSATLLNWCGIGPDLIPWIEDTTPGKIGKFTPGSHIPVRAPGEGKPDTYLLFAWNYLPSVVRREAGFLAGGGRLIIPGPVPVLL